MKTDLDLRPTRSIICVVAAVLSAGAVAIAPAGAAPSDGCPDIEVVFARGTDDTSDGRSIAAHSDYPAAGLTSQAAGFVAGLV